MFGVRPGNEFVVVTMGGGAAKADSLLEVLPTEDDNALLGGGKAESPNCRLTPAAGVAIF
jgi:hypothetical protein